MKISIGMEDEAWILNNAETTFQQVLQYKSYYSFQDPAESDKGIDLLLSEEDIISLQEHGDKLPSIAAGRQISPSMVNFAKSVTKAYYICFTQFIQFVCNNDQLLLDDLG